MDIRETLIVELDEARARLYGLVQDFDPVVEVYPGWTVKELLAHLTGWDDLVIAALEAVMNNEPMPMSAITGVDPYNASTVSERSNLPLERIRHEFHSTGEVLKTTIRRLPAERYDEVVDLPWGGRASIASMIRIFSHHEHEHYGEIVAHMGLNKPAETT